MPRIKQNELWNLDQEIIKFVLPRLKAFRKMKRHGCPPDLKTMNKWNQVLDQMIFALETSEEDFYRMMKIPEKDWKSHCFRVKKGRRLFGEYLGYLWD